MFPLPTLSSNPREAAAASLAARGRGTSGPLYTDGSYQVNYDNGDKISYTTANPALISTTVARSNPPTVPIRHAGENPGTAAEAAAQAVAPLQRANNRAAQADVEPEFTVSQPRWKFATLEERRTGRDFLTGEPINVDQKGNIHPTVSRNPNAGRLRGTAAASAPATEQAAAMNAFMRQSVAQAAQNHHALGSKEMQVPSEDDPEYVPVLRRRAAAVGSADLLDRILRNNPTALAHRATGDARLAKLPGAKGAVPSDHLHPLANDPDFLEAVRQKPDQAKALYAAITNRDYETDLTAKTKQGELQRGNRTQVIESLKNKSPEYDEVDGSLHYYVEESDGFGNKTRKRVKASPLEEMAVKAEGGFQSTYGFELPNKGGLERRQGWTEEDHAKLVARVREHVGKGLPLDEARKRSHAELLAEEQRASGAPAITDGDDRPGWIRTGDALGQFALTGLNTLNRATERPLQHIGVNVPLLPVPTTSELIQRHKTGPSVKDLLRRAGL